MELDGILRRIRRLQDLASLFAALGLQPLGEVIPGIAGRRSREPAFAVARLQAFTWFALTSCRPEVDARKLARQLVARARPAGVVVLDPESRRLAFSVALAGTPVLAVELERPAPLALSSLGRLARSGEQGTLAYAVRVADALSAEEAGVRFFRQFRATVEQMSAALPAGLRGEDRRGYVLLQLTRVLFLYFVQAKGWLGGRQRFLSEEVDRCLGGGRNIHRDLLRPLFFGTLNRPYANRGRTAVRLGAIPFLNGGLFEPHPLERGQRRDLGNAAWREAFDGLFERFQFTVREDANGTDIAPDMLGRVFEGVMAPDVRRASGTYYTPSALVRNILDAAVPVAIAARLACDEADATRLLAAGSARAIAAAHSLTILDPAVGSGAFLLGALEQLSAIGVRGTEDEAACKRRVLSRNLFGVDRSATAVRLAELRLWLAVIAADRAERPGRVQPLPNLDCLVRQGDSLFDPVSHSVGTDTRNPSLASRVAEVRHAVVNAVGAAKRSMVRELQALEDLAAREALAAVDERVRRNIAECIEGARGRDLFGQRRGLDTELKDRLVPLRRELRAVRTARRTLEKNHELPWFHYQSHFADVFAAGGFDLVVGNPPWLRAEEIAPEQRQRLGDRYRWWRSAGQYGHRPDLSIAFVERALELAAPGGTIALLVPAKVTRASYGASFRHAIASTTTLCCLSDLSGHPDASFDATVYPLALIARKAPPPPQHRLRTSLAPGRGASILQAPLAGGGPWVLRGGRGRRVLAERSLEHPQLGSLFTCHLGLKTGANAVFLNPPASIENHLVRPALRGRDLRPFTPAPSARLLYTHGPDGAPLNRLPPGAAAYLAAHEAALRKRADFKGGPSWMLFRTGSASARHRVVWADLCRQLTAVALSADDDERVVPLNTCYVLAAESKAMAERVTAWLNSTWIRAAARCAAMPAANDFARFGAGVVGSLPLPTTALADVRLEALSRRARQGERVQHELDDLAAQHLGLSASDQAAVRSLVDERAAHRR